MTHTTKPLEHLVIIYTDNVGEHCYKCKPTILAKNLILLNSDNAVISVEVFNLYTGLMYMSTKENYMDDNIYNMIREYTNKTI